MTVSSDTIGLQCPPGLQWVKDASQIVIVGERQDTPITLQGREAVIWEWLTLAYPYPKLLRLTAELLRVPIQTAAGELASIVQRWQALGLLETRDDPNG